MPNPQSSPFHLSFNFFTHFRHVFFFCPKKKRKKGSCFFVLPRNFLFFFFFLIGSFLQTAPYASWSFSIRIFYTVATSASAVNVNLLTCVCVLPCSWRIAYSFLIEVFLFPLRLLLLVLSVGIFTTRILSLAEWPVCKAISGAVLNYCYQRYVAFSNTFSIPYPAFFSPPPNWFCKD